MGLSSLLWVFLLRWVGSNGLQPWSPPALFILSMILLSTFYSEGNKETKASFLTLAHTKMKIAEWILSGNDVVNLQVEIGTEKSAAVISWVNISAVKSPICKNRSNPQSFTLMRDITQVVSFVSLFWYSEHTKPSSLIKLNVTCSKV